MTDALTPTAAQFLSDLGVARTVAKYDQGHDLTRARAFGWEGYNAFEAAMLDGTIASIDNGLPEPDTCFGVPVTYDPSKLPRPYAGRSYGRKK
jgi:hypothetical protein